MTRIAPRALNALALNLGLVGASLGCTATHVARPDEMSRSAHAREARTQEREGSAEAARYDPNALVVERRCEPVRVGVQGGILAVPCWTSLANPTDVHRQRAAEHRQQAADHRAASQILRDAELQACAGIPEFDRDMSPFEHGEDIASVEPFTEINGANIPLRRTTGAVVTFRALPGMTAEWLQRVVDCHLARNASLGHVVPEMPNCPLVPRGAEARVDSTGNGFAVTIRSEDEASAREILARALRSQG